MGARENIKLQKPQISQNEIYLTHDDFSCVFSIPVKFEIYFLGPLKSLKKECDMALKILGTRFCPLKIKIIQLPNAFRLNCSLDKRKRKIISYLGN